MRINYRPDFLSLGNLFINVLSRVTELDSGLLTGPSQYTHLPNGDISAQHSHETLQTIESQLAIVVPCMNEPLPTLQGVLAGIPPHSQIIIISNSNATNYLAERALLSTFLRDSSSSSSPRRALLIHQSSPSLAHAFSTAGLPHVLSPDAPRLRAGKGEAMLAGTALAKVSGAQFVGYIDADNLVPGAVHEYCKVFAAGLYHAVHAPFLQTQVQGQGNRNGNVTEGEPLAMVRVKWKSKPKIEGGRLVHREKGRCSAVVNKWMNRFVDGVVSGSEGLSGVVHTANAGEHAMSVELAMKLGFATGYAVEPWQIVEMVERAVMAGKTQGAFLPGDEGISRAGELKAMGRSVRILQVETMNPHIHDFGKGDTHIKRMQAQGLSTMLHSRLIGDAVKEELRAYMRDELGAVVGEEGVPEEARVYPAMESLNWELFRAALDDEDLFGY